ELLADAVRIIRDPRQPESLVACGIKARGTSIAFPILLQRASNSLPCLRDNHPPLCTPAHSVGVLVELCQPGPAVLVRLESRLAAGADPWKRLLKPTGLDLLFLENRFGRQDSGGFAGRSVLQCGKRDSDHSRTTARLGLLASRPDIGGSRRPCCGLGGVSPPPAPQPPPPHPSPFS